MVVPQPVTSLDESAIVAGRKLDSTTMALREPTYRTKDPVLQELQEEPAVGEHVELG